MNIIEQLKTMETQLASCVQGQMENLKEADSE